MTEIKIGTGFGSTLIIVFLVLKLTEVIDWSWWWITAPLWIPISIILMILLFVGLIIIMANN